MTNPDARIVLGPPSSKRTSWLPRLGAAGVVAIGLAGCAGAPPDIVEADGVRLIVSRDGTRYIETARVLELDGGRLLMGRVRYPVPHISEDSPGHVDRRIASAAGNGLACTMRLRVGASGPPGAHATFHGELPDPGPGITVHLQYHDASPHEPFCDAG